MPERVLVISVDGLAPRAITPELMPHLCGLARSGGACFTARTVIPSITVPAHASMFRGVDPATHGLFDNTPRPPGGVAPSFLAHATAAGRSTASVLCWTPLDLLLEHDAVCHRTAWAAGYDPNDDLTVTARTVEALELRPDLTLSYLVATDLAGHASGWDSDQYRAAAASIDARLGELFDAAGPETAIVVTTDHGGSGHNHFDPVPDTLETFVVARSSRIAPGSWWPTASILDIAPTVADLLGIEPSSEWVGQSLTGRESAWADEVVRLIESMAAESYGERVDMLSHSLQTAANVRHAGGDETLQLAGLLHDIGHVLGQHTDAATEWGVPGHAEVGARWLQQWLPASVVEPIRLHVAAKRYMVAVDPGYRAELSPASIATLEQQGGPLTADEAAAFGNLPFAEAAVLLRRCDDLGKIPDAPPEPPASYRELLVQMVSDTTCTRSGVDRLT